MGVRQHPGQRVGPKSLQERYRIPQALIETMIRSGTAKVATVGDANLSDSGTEGDWKCRHVFEPEPSYGVRTESVCKLCDIYEKDWLKEQDEGGFVTETCEVDGCDNECVEDVAAWEEIWIIYHSREGDSFPTGYQAMPSTRFSGLCICEDCYGEFQNQTSKQGIKGISDGGIATRVARGLGTSEYFDDDDEGIPNSLDEPEPEPEPEPEQLYQGYQFVTTSEEDD